MRRALSVLVFTFVMALSLGCGKDGSGGRTGDPPNAPPPGPKGDDTPAFGGKATPDGQAPRPNAVD
jgi:hypothetical protein